MRTDSLNTLDEVSEGPDETACIRMQSRLHGEVLVGFLFSLCSFHPDVVACAGAPARSAGGSGGAGLCSRIMIRSGGDTGGWKGWSSESVMPIGSVRMSTGGE